MLKEETRINEDVIQQNINKIHLIGQPEDSKQCRIVKFTSDSLKKRVFMKHKQRKKPILKSKKKQMNKCQSDSTSNPHSPNAGWNYYNMRKKTLKLSKKLSFLIQSCMGFSKLYWTLRSGIGTRLGLRQRKMLVKFSRLWVLAIMKGYRMRNTKGFSFWKSHWHDHPISLLNQVSL